MRKIIIDCDPGHDDAIALLVALAHKKELEILGITTVGGNQTLENTTQNALKILEFIDEDITVSAGYASPIIKEPVNAGYAHGSTGLDGAGDLTTTRRSTGIHAIRFIANTLRNSNEKITIVTMGPLTNIALFLKTYPELKEKIEEIVIMGGGIYAGNILPKAEFNAYQDPEAAKIVIESNLNKTLVPVEACADGKILIEEMKELKQKGRVSKLAYSIFDFYSRGRRRHEIYNVVIYDATTIIYLLYPELFETKEMIVTVETEGNATRGMTVCDERNGWKKSDVTPTKVLTHTLREPFVNVIFDSLSYLDTKSL